MDFKLIILFGFILLIQIYFTNQIPIGGKLQENIDCSLPNKNIYGNVLFDNEAIEWEQKRQFWLTMDVYTKSLNDCINQCYGYRFCYSILFLSNNSIRKACRLFLHSSDECNGKTLLSINKIEKISLEENKNQIVVECLKCRKIENNEDNPLISGPEDAPKGFKKLISSDDQQKVIKQNDDPLKSSIENGAEANKAIISPKNQGGKNIASENLDDEAIAIRKERQIWRACLVTFEVYPEIEREKALANFKLSKTASVSSLNECAFICYQNACSNVLFELGPGGEGFIEGSGVRLSKCHLDMESKTETCSGNLQRHYSYPNINMTLMSCVRCVAKKPTTISPFAEIVLRSTAATPTQETLNTKNNSQEILKTEGITEQTYKSENEVTTQITPLILENNPLEEENELNNSTNNSTTILLTEEITQQTSPSSLFQKEIIQDETDQFKNSTIIEAKGLAAIDTKINRISNNNNITFEETTISTKEEENIEETTPAEEEINILPIKVINEHENVNGSTRPKSVGLAISNRQKQIKLENSKKDLSTTTEIIETSFTSTISEKEEKDLLVGSINLPPENKNSELKLIEITSTTEGSTTKGEEEEEEKTTKINKQNEGENNKEFISSDNNEKTKNPLEEEDQQTSIESSIITTNIPLTTTIESKIEEENITLKNEEIIPLVGIINENNKINNNNQSLLLLSSSSTNNPPGFGPNIKEEEEENEKTSTILGIIGNVKINSSKTNEEEITSTISNVGEINESTYSSSIKNLTNNNEQQSNFEGEGFIGEKEENNNINISTKIPETEQKMFGISQENDNEPTEVSNEFLLNNSTTLFTTTTIIEENNKSSTNEPNNESEEIKGPIIIDNSETNLNETKNKTNEEFETNVTTPENYETNITTTSNNISDSTEKEGIIGLIPFENEKTSSEIPNSFNITEAESEINESTLVTKEGIIESELPINSELNATTTEINYENATITSVFETISSTTEKEVFVGVIPFENEKEVETNVTTPEIKSKEIIGEIQINATTPTTYEVNVTGVSESTTTKEKEDEQIFGVIPSNNEEKEASEIPVNSNENATTPNISSNNTEAETLQVTNEANITTTVFTTNNDEKEKLGAIAGALNILNFSELNVTKPTIINNNETEESTFVVTEANTTKPGIEIEGAINSLNESKTEIPLILTTISNETSTNEEEIIAAMHETETETSDKSLESIPENTTAKEEIITQENETTIIGGFETTPGTYEANITTTEAIALSTQETETDGIIGGIHDEEKESSEILENNEENATTSSIIFESTTTITKLTTVKESLAIFGNGNEEFETNVTTPEYYEANSTIKSFSSEEISLTNPENETKEESFGIIPFGTEKEKSEGFEGNSTEFEITGSTSENKLNEIIGTTQTLEINATTTEETNKANNNVTVTGINETSSAKKEEELFVGVIPFENEKEESSNTTNTPETILSSTGITESNLDVTNVTETDGELIGAAQAKQLNNESTESQLKEFEIEGVIRNINETKKEKEVIPVISEANNNTTPLSSLEEGILPGVILLGDSEENNITKTTTTTTIAIETLSTQEDEKEVSKVFGVISEEENVTTSVIEANTTKTPESEAIGIFGIKPQEEKEISELNTTIESTTQIEEDFKANVSTTLETETKIFGIVNDNKEEEILNNNTVISTTLINEAENENNETSFATTEGPINIVVLGPSELFGGATENATIKSSDNETINETEIEGTLNELNISLTTPETKLEEEGMTTTTINNKTEIINETENETKTEKPIIGLEGLENTTTTTIINNNNITEEMPELINAVSQIVQIKKLEVTEPTVTAITKLVDFVENNNGSIGDIKQHNFLKDFGNRVCNGEILFTGEILTDYTQSFEIILASETVYECVKTCFNLNCTNAAFTHFPRSACLLHFNKNELKLEQKCENETNFVSNWNFKQIPEVVSIKCIKCKEEEKILNNNKNEGNERILRDEFSLDNFRKLLNEENYYHNIINPQGVTSKCSGRVEFNIHPVPELHLLDITNDVPADTAADCAKKCFETPNCLTAGFIPTPGHESSGGVCLLTKNTEIKNNCNNQSIHLTPQHASTVPFLINCIKCTECNYSLTISDSKRLIIDSTNSIQTKTINECAIKCSENNCSLAKFDPNKLICSFALPEKLPLPPAELGCPIESGLQTDGIFEVLLNCVKCNK